MTITKEQILEEARIYRSLSNDISDSWDKVLKWKKMSQAELSRRTGLTERTITTTVTGQRIASLDNIVLLCLAANLPSDISGHLIRLSGHALIMSNEEHVIYNYLLKNMYTESLSEIRQFLYDIGSETYLKFPSNT
ncbi:MAG: helix-turn-helix domain-containing protein [Aeriscardovia sp.]|nr:helix-turn-helix domain-containing protein [Aeriscardovia sp.]